MDFEGSHLTSEYNTVSLNVTAFVARFLLREREVSEVSEVSQEGETSMGDMLEEAQPPIELFGWLNLVY